MFKTKKVLAAFLAMTILMTNVPIESMAAQLEEGFDDAVVHEILEEESAIADEPAEQATVMAEESTEQYLIQYLMVEQSNVALGSTQQIVIGLDCEKVLEEVILYYTNQDTGEQFEQLYSEIVDGAALFELAFENEEAIGKYQLDAVSFKVEGKTYTEYFEETGIVAVFGVEQNIEIEPDAIVVEEESEELEIDTSIVRFDENGNIVSEVSLEEAIENVALEQPSMLGLERDKALVVVLDPGHDNTHAGAQYYGLKEETLNLKIALYCKEELEEYQGVKVYLTRSGNEKCPYPGTDAKGCNENRVKYASSVGADIFVSLHNNASTSTSVKGAMVFYPNANYNPGAGSEGEGLAKKIQQQLVALGLYDRGISIENSKDNTLYPDGSLADYYGVIRNSKEAGIPAIIVEHAFMSNKSDVNGFLSSDAKLKELGVADARAIASYYKLGKENIVVTSGTVEVTNLNNSAGTAVISIKDVAPVNKLEKVSVAVWSTPDQNDLFWYTMDNTGNGNYQAVLNLQNHKNNYGNYYIDVYAYDTTGKKHYLGGTTCTFRLADVKMTVAADAEQKNYSLKMENVPAAGVKEVKVAVWSQTGGQDDLVWYTATKNASGIYFVKVPISNHKTAGMYYADTYVVAQNQMQYAAAGTRFWVTTPSVDSMQIENKNDSAGTFEVSFKGISSKSGVKNIKVAVWSQADQSDLQWYLADAKSDGSYGTKVNIANHKYNYGKYYVDAYMTTNNGIYQYIGGKTPVVYLPNARAVAKENASQTKYKLELSNVGLRGGVKNVKIAVWSQNGGQDDLKWYSANNLGNGQWSAEAVISNHKTAGLYYADAYATDINGKSAFLTGTTFRVDDISGAEVLIQNLNCTKGKFQVVIKNAKTASGIAQIQVPVWSQSNQSDLKWYTAKKQDNGSYIAYIDIANHNYRYAKYFVDVYGTAQNGIKKYLGGQKVNMNFPITEVKVTANESEKIYTLKSDYMELPFQPLQVKVAVWSQNGGQDDLRWYYAKKNAEGFYTAQIEIENHKTAGMYYADMYVVAQNQMQYAAAGTRFWVTTPSVDSMEIENKNDGAGTFGVSFKGISSKSGVKNIKVAVWSQADQSDLQWYLADAKSDGSYSTKVNIANHKYNYGKYYVDAYMTTNNGIYQYISGKTPIVYLPKAKAVAKENDSQTKYKLELSNVGLQGGVKNVKIAVWSQNGGQDDLKWYSANNLGNGQWSAEAVISNHKTAGLYYADAYATDINGKSVFLTGTRFQVQGPKVASVQLERYDEAAGTFTVQMTGVKAAAGISEVKVAVWSTANQNNLVWYHATKSSDGIYRVNVDIKNHKNHRGTYYADVYVTDATGIKAYGGGINCKITDVSNTLYPIMGDTSVTIEQLMAYYNTRTSYPAFYATSDAPTLRDFCRMYIEECQAEGVKAEVAFCQAMKETNFLRYGGSVSIEQYNFAGLGSLGNGISGNYFSCVREGIRAQVQHLKAYASVQPLNNSCVDPRFKYVERGTAIYTEWLGIQENPYGKGWAATKNYGYELVEMIKILKQ